MKKTIVLKWLIIVGLTLSTITFIGGCVSTVVPDEEEARRIILQETFNIIENDFPKELAESYPLPTVYAHSGKTITLEWESSEPSIMNSSGVIARATENVSVTLSVILTLESTSINKDIVIVILKDDDSAADTLRIQEIFDKVTLPVIINRDLLLPTLEQFPDVIHAWECHNGQINDNVLKYEDNGVIKLLKVSLELTIGEKSMIKQYEIESTTSSNFYDLTRSSYPINWDSGKFNNLKLDETNQLVLIEGFTTGTYESEIITMPDFKKIIGSWSAITSTTSTVSLSFKSRINGVWSDYVGYGHWGLGLENKCLQQNDSKNMIAMKSDEITVLSSSYADALMFKIELRGDSPKLRSISFAVDGTVNSSKTRESLPSKVSYEVPTLYQNSVPSIGNIICSPTSSTMLMKYKGQSFISHDVFEHRYIAKLCYDYTNQIYGNWVFNVAVIGAYNHDAFVGRLTGIEELLNHLASVGPVAASVRGNMQGNYTTNGHLIVIKGYEIIDGKLKFLCNDPNMPAVNCTYTEETITNTWRGVIYAIV